MLLRPRIRQHVAPVPVDTMQVRIKASSPFLILAFYYYTSTFYSSYTSLSLSLLL